VPHHSLPPITGFVDAHVHIRDVLGFGCAAAAGITVLRDAGNRENAHRGIPFDAVAHHGLRVVSSGWALFKKGGYGSAFGIPVEGRNDFHDEISRLKAAGAGIIKVMASGMVSLKKRETITPGGFDKDELAALVQEARNQGLEVMAHANGEQAIINSAEAGVRSLEHGFFMTARALDALAKRGASWTPTVGALARAADSGDVSKEMKTAVKELIRSHLAMIRRRDGLRITRSRLSGSLSSGAGILRRGGACARRSAEDRRRERCEAPGNITNRVTGQGSRAREFLLGSFRGVVA